MQKCPLDTVYRSTDEEHELFCNQIRDRQPERSTLEGYFGDRHGGEHDLVDCVRFGLQRQQHTKQPLAWLTCTHKGASEVCRAALAEAGVAKEELTDGYYSDPTSKSDLPIVFKKGLLYRLTRNIDKQRGFVNGALAEGVESLDANRVFTVRPLASGSMVLVHPMNEDGQRFWPCCDGYATTIRRAQGCGFYRGCIYFDLSKRHAAKVYGYVAESRLKTKQG